MKLPIEILVLVKIIENYMSRSEQFAGTPSDDDAWYAY